MTAVTIPISQIHSPPPIEKLQWHEKVNRTAQNCFESLKTILTFPLRYLGSKSWSIPGVILRAPYLLFKRIFYRSSVPIAKELFQNNYHYFFEKELSPEELKPYLPPAASTLFIYSRDTDDLLPKWKCISPDQFGPAKGIAEPSGSGFYDPISDLTAVILEKEDDAIICFGPLNPAPGIEKQTPLLKRIYLTISAIMTNSPPSVRNAAQLFLGFNPSLYERADAFVEWARHHPRLKNRKVTLTGLCFGGAIASYVAIKRGIQGVSFNSFPLGIGAQSDLGQKRLDLADQYVTHICTKKDYLTDRPSFPYLDLFASRIGLRTPGHFGRRFLIPSAFTSPASNHARPLPSVVKHLGYPENTPMKELSLEFSSSPR